MRDRKSDLSALASAVRKMNQFEELMRPSRTAALAEALQMNQLGLASKAIAKAGIGRLSPEMLRIASGVEFGAIGSMARGIYDSNLGVTRLAELGIGRDTFEQIKALEIADPMRGLSPELIGRIRDAERAVMEPFQYSGAAASAVAEMEVAHRAMMSAVSPLSLGQIGSLASAAAAMVPSHPRLAVDSLWEKSLAERMGVIDAPWAAAGYFDRSAFAFGSLARLSDTLAFDDPFSVATRTYVEDEFGEVVEFDDGEIDREEKYDEAGRDPALVAFPHEEYPSILRAAGFYQIEIPMPPAPQPIANAEGIAIFSEAHESALRSVELHLRLFLTNQLRSLNPNWEKQRVPGDIRNRWKLRQDEYRAAGAPVYELIHYADFNDLAQIITRTDNWNELFKSVFGDKDGVQVSLRRLSPLRNNNAHLRPLTPSELLFLLAEATRLLRAIGVIQTH